MNLRLSRTRSQDLSWENVKVWKPDSQAFGVIPQPLCLWQHNRTELELKLTCLRSGAGQQLLEEIAASGAAGTSKLGLKVPEDQAEPLQELIDGGYCTLMKLLHREDHQLYTLTSRGMECVKPCIKLVQLSSLEGYRRKGLEWRSVDLEQFTTLELISKLKEDGWEERIHKKTKKLEAYRDGAEKLWYRTTGVNINRQYLMALAVAHVRFREGLVREVHHFQPMNYYLCIYQGYKNVLPNQPFSYYKALKQGRRHSSNQDILDEPDCIEDDR